LGITHEARRRPVGDWRRASQKESRGGGQDMGAHLRSAGVPLLLTLGLAVILVLGVHDLEGHKHAACADSSLARSVWFQGPDASGVSRGAAYLSRFDRAEVWGCNGPETVRHAATEP
jgi:hypothetical protein